MIAESPKQRYRRYKAHQVRRLEFARREAGIDRPYGRRIHTPPVASPPPQAGAAPTTDDLEEITMTTFQKGDLVRRGETIAFVEGDPDERQGVQLIADGRRFVGYAPHWTLLRPAHPEGSKIGRPKQWNNTPQLSKNHVPTSKPTCVITRERTHQDGGVRYPVTLVAVQWSDTWTCFMAFGCLSAADVCALGTRLPYEMAHALFPAFVGRYLLVERVKL